MEDLVGADLQAESGSSVLEATPVPTPTANGETRDARGNVYEGARQAASRASELGGTSAQPGATPGADGSYSPQATPQPTPPAMDPAIMQAVQMAQYRAAQAEARVAQYEQSQWEAAVRQLPADQQRVAIAQRQAQLTAAQYQQAAQRQAQQQQALEPLFKEVVVSKLTQQYGHAGVNAQMLSRFTSPEAMEEFARNWAADRRATVNAQRTSAGVDRAASAGSASRSTPQSWRGTSLTEQLSAAFQ